MNQWEQRIQDSEAISKLQGIVEGLSAIDSRSIRWSTDSPRPEILQATRVVVSKVLDDLTGADPRLVTQQQLDRLNSPIGTIGEALTNFLNERGEGGNYTGGAHIDGLPPRLDELLEAARTLPPQPWGERSEVVRRATERFRDQASSQSRRMSAAIREFRQATATFEQHVSESREAVEAQLREIQSEAEATLADTRTAVDELKGEATASISTETQEFSRRADELATRVTEQTNRLDAALDRLNNSFNDAQTERDDTFRSVIEDFIETFDNFMNERIVASGSLIAYLDERAESARSIVAATAAASAAQQYVKAEESESRSADRWRQYGLSILTVTVLAGVFVGFRFGPSLDAGWEAFLTFYLVKAPLSALAIYMGAYALHQAGGHRGRANEAGRIARELSVFRPFIDELPDEKREVEISSAAGRYFLGSNLDTLTEGDSTPTVPRAQ